MAKTPQQRKLKYRDIYKEGVSVSWLSRFINCRERFRLGYVMGLREKGSKDAIDFGTIFHKLLEWHSQNVKVRQLDARLAKWLATKFGGSTPTHKANMAYLGRMAIILFRQYVEYYKKDDFTYFASEQVFREQYTLNSGRSLDLRGRMDEIIKDPRGLILQENKTHGTFDPEHIKAKLPKNLQTMFYCTAIQLLYGETPAGVLYNIARKPQLKQGKKETETAFLKRIDTDISDRPTHYFFRHEHAPATFAQELAEWQLRTLHPQLEAVCDWWESIRSDPTNPWVIQGPNGPQANPFHYERPFGIYEPMTQGKGEFYDLLVRGSKVGLEIVDDIFPELQDD